MPTEGEVGGFPTLCRHLRQSVGAIEARGRSPAGNFPALGRRIGTVAALLDPAASHRSASGGRVRQFAADGPRAAAEVLSVQVPSAQRRAARPPTGQAARQGLRAAAPSNALPRP
jgi:hypothetical protein